MHAVLFVTVHVDSYVGPPGEITIKGFVGACLNICIIYSAPIEIPVNVTVADSYWLYNILKVSMSCYRSPSEDEPSHFLGSGQTIFQTLRGVTFIFNTNDFRPTKSRV